ncbi:MAG: Lipopolysaccharide assembly protein B [bacterium]|nr:Lipopolysaccharide assembly protein B [bacterium]
MGWAQTPQTQAAFEAFTLGDYRAALQLYKEARAADPADTTAIFYQGLCYFNLGEYDHCLQTLQAITGSPSFRARAYYFIAKAEEAGGAISSALDDVRRALRADSTFMPARKLLGQLLCANKQFAAAVDAIDSSATADVIAAVGNCLLASARCAEAMTMARQILAADSTHFTARLLLADAYFCSENFEKAAATYLQLYAQIPNYPRILRRLGSCYLNMQNSRYELAESYLKAYLAATGDSSSGVLTDIGRAYQGRALFDSAAVYFAATVRQDTTIAFSHFNLGLTYYQLKKYHAAEAEMRKAIACSKSGLDFSSRQHYMLGAAHMSQNENKAAIQAYRKAIELNADCYDCYYFLGTVYQTLNDAPKAAAYFRSFLQRTAQLTDDRFGDMRKNARQFLLGAKSPNK